MAEKVSDAPTVTDPALPAQAGGGWPQRVTDPELLAALNSYLHPDDAGVLHSIRSALHAADPYVRAAEPYLHAAEPYVRAVDPYMRSVANAVTGGQADRFAARMGAATGVGGDKGNYSGNLKTEQTKTERFSHDHPIANAATQTAATLAMLPETASVEGLSLGARAVRGLAGGIPIGAAQGALSSKDLTDLPQTLWHGFLGAVTGGVLGGTIPIVGSGAGKTMNWAADRIRSTAGMSREAARRLLKALQPGGPDAVRAELDRLGPDAMLLDTSPAMRGTAQGAALNSDEGGSVMRDALTARDKGTSARITSDADAALGPAEDPETVINAINAHRAQVEHIAFPAALGNAPPVRTASILQQFDTAIPRSVGMERKALENLRDMMMTAEQRPRLYASGRQQVNRRGQAIFDRTEVPQNDAEVLHKVRQELDNVIDYDAPGLGVPAGAVAHQQGMLKWFRLQLNNALERQVPGYAEANAMSEVLAKRAEAVRAGTQYLGAGRTTPSPQRFAAGFELLSQEERNALAKGSRGDIARIVGTKADDLPALRSELLGDGGWNAANLATVHGQEAADQLAGSVERNLKFRETYDDIVKKSEAARQQAAADAMKLAPPSETPLINPNMTLTGFTGTLAKKAGAGLVNALLEKDPEKSYGEIARILSAQGPEARAYLDALAGNLNRRAAVAPTLNRLGDRASLALILGGGRYLRSRFGGQSDKQ
jgi:hypothetical protein